MNQIAERFHHQLEETIMQAKSTEDHIKLDAILLDREKWLNTYNEPDRKDVLYWILETDEKLNNLLKQKSEALQEKILEEEQLNRNRGTFKLYE
ncbi:hypothetical protein O0Q50_21585 [Priestia aryabhattai]|uniref:Uncharacterized protein n=1 Tax=Priestia aryabhattai TaxID=412384 RepID=A0AAX6NCX2_PRIAR|nr:hypothetical protein [Priestia aryabhattai]MDU9693773.1 hypothetical protein [Priestia aryabhattai]